MPLTRRRNRVSLFGVVLVAIHIKRMILLQPHAHKCSREKATMTTTREASAAVLVLSLGTVLLVAAGRQPDQAKSQDDEESCGQAAFEAPHAYIGKDAWLHPASVPLDLRCPSLGHSGDVDDKTPVTSSLRTHGMAMLEMIFFFGPRETDPRGERFHPYKTWKIQTFSPRGPYVSRLKKKYMFG